MTDTAHLIERLEKEGGSRELDAEIGMLFPIAATGDYGEPLIGGLDEPYTTSLDAAIALCERKTETREQFVGVFDKGVDLWLISGDEDHRTMPKYAVLALLRALSTEDGK